MTKKKNFTPRKKIEKKNTIPDGSLSKILSERKDIQQKDFRPKIAVIGIGGGGGNILNNLIKMGLEDVETIACNTDAQALEKSLASIKIQLGPNLTKGHGAGANNEIGKIAAKESEEEIRKTLEGFHMAFVIACMGGGTGTGAAEIVGKIALDLGILTLGFATTPFDFEGMQRKKTAYNGLEGFQKNSDVLIVFGNQNLFSVTTEETTLTNAFSLTDEKLCIGVESVVKTISNFGLINTDLADFFTIMKGKKSRARMGTGIADGQERGLHAAQEAMASPLLELDGMISKDIDGAIICIRCGEDVALYDINQAVNHIRDCLAENAYIIFGAIVDSSLHGKIQISLFATSSGIANKKEEEKYNIVDYNKTDHTNLKIENFQELIADDVELGRTHEMLHEENLNIEYNKQEFVIKKNKKGFFAKIFGLFKRQKNEEKDDLPSYLKKDKK